METKNFRQNFFRDPKIQALSLREKLTLIYVIINADKLGILDLETARHWLPEEAGCPAAILESLASKLPNFLVLPACGSIWIKNFIGDQLSCRGAQLLRNKISIPIRKQLRRLYTTHRELHDLIIAEYPELLSPFEGEQAPYPIPPTGAQAVPKGPKRGLPSHVTRKRSSKSSGSMGKSLAPKEIYPKKKSSLSQGVSPGRREERESYGMSKVKEGDQRGNHRKEKGILGPSLEGALEALEGLYEKGQIEAVWQRFDKTKTSEGYWVGFQGERIHKPISWLDKVLRNGSWLGSATTDRKRKQNELDEIISEIEGVEATHHLLEFTPGEWQRAEKAEKGVRAKWKALIARKRSVEHDLENMP